MCCWVHARLGRGSILLTLPVVQIRNAERRGCDDEPVSEDSGTVTSNAPLRVLLPAPQHEPEAGR